MTDNVVNLRVGNARALRRVTLDQMQCAVPGCTHQDHPVMFLTQGCHPRAGVQAKYLRGRGILVIECRQCKQKVADIAVAE